MKKILILLLVVVVAAAVAWYLVTRDRPPAPDEAMERCLERDLDPEALEACKQGADYVQAPDEADYFHGMDGGEKFEPSQVRGRNTWLVWTGGNEAFWDYLANNSFGTFDLLKTVSSYPCSPEQEAHFREVRKARYGSAGGYGTTGGYGSGYGGAGPYGYGDSYGYGESGYGAADPYGDMPGDPSYSHYNRATRREYLGLVNEPGFRAATRPGQYGLCLDELVGPPEPFDEEVYGRSAGVVGLRIFPNPNFDDRAQEAWDPERYYTDPDYYLNPKLVRPYRVGMSCGFCHINPHPMHPADDPENPEWENLSGTIGAQYFWFGRIFAPNVTKDNFVWHLLDSQKPGAVDTSFVPADNINNPRAMNAVFNVGERLGNGDIVATETATGGALSLPEVKRNMESPDAESSTFGVPHILWDGADSVGIDAALTRVYINIGEYHQEWLRHIRPIIGGKVQSPISVADAQEASVFWNATQERAPDMAQYLIRAGYPYRLADAPGGADYLQADEATLERGKVVFAEHCARCHVSANKLPEPPVALAEPGCVGDGYLDCWKRYWEWTETEEYKAMMREVVLADDFLDDNYLSNDARIPVHQPLVDFEPEDIPSGLSTLERYLEETRQRGLATGALETEYCSAMSSNALEGHVWDNFASQSYKDLPALGEVELYDPIGDRTFTWLAQGGGRGYQRVPSLVGIWSTAPYLHNNELGRFTNDPSVAGRMEAFEDGMRKLLWPEERQNIVRTTDRTTYLRVNHRVLPEAVRGVLDDSPFARFVRWAVGIEWLTAGPESQLVQVGPIPKGTPVSLLANIAATPYEGDVHFQPKKLVSVLLQARSVFSRIHEEQLSDEEAKVLVEELAPALMEVSNCPDFVVDRGHYFGTDLSDEDKQALIEFVETL